jgi:hypothetical protein
MKVLINPTITFSEVKKKSIYGFTATLDKSNPNQLTIKARSFDGKSKNKSRSRGIAGVISRDGTISIAESHRKMLTPLLTTEKRSTINITLDLIFGANRLKSCTLNTKGHVHFKK